MKSYTAREIPSEDNGSFELEALTFDGTLETLKTNIGHARDLAELEHMGGRVVYGEDYTSRRALVQLAGLSDSVRERDSFGG